ncbi:hypothetical protein EJ03DRAFT_355636 [Teratosphaeria nubilosa]|uniref:Uncharacterized protein n=1 Tax=Teratosphaeria nubilosa TaxID=161662 RepID=A0A6G1KWM2_9PEZI|nr:hypothetical protein EJ03DRAFT_355636 [Teratosphaeria nubilosa]
MTVVRIFVQAPTQTGLLYTMNEEKIRAASSTIDNASTRQPYAPVKSVEISGAAPAAFRFVLTCIDEHEKSKRRPGDELRIKAHEEPLAGTTAIYEAIEVLGIKPPQPHIENHIIGHIAHNTLRPNELVTPHKTFVGRRETSKAWRTLVHQTAYYVVYQEYTPEEADALQRAVAPYPELRSAIETKIVNELLPRKAFEDETRANIETGLAVGRGEKRIVAGKTGRGKGMRIEGEMSP